MGTDGELDGTFESFVSVPSNTHVFGCVIDAAVANATRAKIACGKRNATGIHATYGLNRDGIVGHCLPASPRYKFVIHPGSSRAMGGGRAPVC